MRTKIKISPKLVLSISTLYEALIRVILELVDNSLDSCENIYKLIQGKMNYAYLINISIIKKGGNFKEGKIIISDNCLGIINLASVIRNIGNSGKKAQSWTNGQFGYGIFSFMAVCNTMEIYTKTKNGKAQYVKINRSAFESDNIDNVYFDVIESKDPFPYESGTVITLSGFSKESWNSINSEEFADEIERHFELLLKRENLNISVISDSFYRICKPFDYSAYEGEVFERTISIKPTRRLKLNSNDSSIRIFLKYTSGLSLDRPIVFISINRRGANVGDIKSFRSFKKSIIWQHPNVTGYIDTGNLLDPTIARNNYTSDGKSRMVFREIRKIEDEIEDFIKRQAERNVKTDFTIIEDSINGAIRNLKGDMFLNYSTAKAGDKVELSDDPNDPLYEVEVLGKKPRSGKKHAELSYSEMPDIEFKPSTITVERNVKTLKSGNINLILKIDGESEPFIDKNGKPKRSELVGDEVIVFKNHPDFMERLKRNRIGEELISQRLIIYIISEVMVHYLSQYFEINYQNNFKDKDKLVAFAANLYFLENKLVDLIGQPILKIK